MPLDTPVNSDFEILQNLLKQGAPIAQKAKGKNIVLVLGDTGAGKSTTIDYLLHQEMTKIVVKNRIIHRIGVRGNPIASIGHDKNSHTLFPAIYGEMDNKENTHFTKHDLIFCDCPGFRDNRGPVIQTAVSMLTEMMIKSAAHVVGIMVVIDYAQFTTTRGKEFADLADTLSKFFKDPESCTPSTLFVVTKGPVSATSDEIKGSLLAELEEMKEAETERRKTLVANAKASVRSQYKAAPFSKTEEELLANGKILTIIDMIISAPANFLAINPLDGGVTKDLLINKLKLFTKPIAIENFDFNKYDSSRRLFHDYMNNLAFKLSKVINTYFKTIKTLALKKEELESCQNNLKTYTSQLQRLSDKLVEYDQPQSSNDEQLRKDKIQIAALNKSIKTKQNEINAYNDQINSLNDEIHSINQELLTLDTSELIESWRDEIKDKRWKILGNLSYTRKYFSYSGKFYTNVEIHPDINQKKYWSSIKQQNGDENTDGYFHATYKSGFGEDGNAMVIIKTEKRLIPENALRIKQLKDELEDKSKSSEILKNNVKKQKKDIQDLKQAQELLSANNLKEKNDINIQIIKYQQYAKSAANNEAELKKEIELEEKEYKDYNSKIKHHESEINLLLTINDLLKLQDSSLISNFLLDYAALQKTKQKDPSLIIDYNEVIVPHEYQCPIGLVLMQDPVLAECGHSFEYSAVIDYISSKDTHRHESAACPLCGEHAMIHAAKLIRNTALRNEIEKWGKQTSTLPELSLNLTQSLSQTLFYKPSNKNSSQECDVAELKKRLKNIKQAQQELRIKLASLIEEEKEINRQLSNHNEGKEEIETNENLYENGLSLD
ncbi:MAG: hypothetical protein Tsb005_21020 [Gammaproteobacteria bacterium]